MIAALATAASAVVGRVATQVAPDNTTGSSPPKLAIPHVEYHLLTPQIVLIASAVLLLAATSVTRRRWRPSILAGWTAVTGLVSIGFCWHLWGQIVGHSARTGSASPGTPHAVSAVANAVAVDGFSLFLVVTLCAALVLGALLAMDYLPREGLSGPEFYVLAMLSTAGAAIMASANDLIVVFLGLEILSISLYVLTGYHFKRNESGEAAIKYFVLGAFSSAFFLYGVALVYGATGSTVLSGTASIASYMSSTYLASDGVLLAGIGLMVVGLGFKVAAVPFHSWIPDVYQGAPSPVTGFMAAAAKVAGFAALMRVLVSALPSEANNWQSLLGVLAALSVVAGAVVAIVQSDIKRMLAYSAILNTGFILVGLVAVGGELNKIPGTVAPHGLAASLFYLFTYTFMVIGSFAVITVVGGKGDGNHSLEAYRGLARRRPLLALAFTILLMGQAGIPFTSGFFAKFYVLASLVALDTTWTYALAGLAMLSTVAAAFFYLRIILTTWSAPAGEGGDNEASLEAVASGGTGSGRAVATAVRSEVTTTTRVEVVPASVAAVLVVCVSVTVLLGVAPGLLVHIVTRATLIL